MSLGFMVAPLKLSVQVWLFVGARLFTPLKLFVAEGLSGKGHKGVLVNFIKDQQHAASSFRTSGEKIVMCARQLSF